MWALLLLHEADHPQSQNTVNTNNADYVFSQILYSLVSNLLHAIMFVKAFLVNVVYVCLGGGEESEREKRLLLLL